MHYPWMQKQIRMNNGVVTRLYRKQEQYKEKNIE